MDSFKDYIYYLLWSPLKKVEKEKNAWWKLAKVYGKLFDDAKAAILRAREETMIATCSHSMLQVHADDRRLTRYEGETNENYRRRIAAYPEVCKLGGTDAGILLAVKTLGFQEPKIVLAKNHRNDESRWAEFYLLFEFDLEEELPIPTSILKRVVRATKETGALDNYELQFHLESHTDVDYTCTTHVFNRCYPHPNNPQMLLDGNWYLDGTFELSDFMNPHIEDYPLLLNGSWELNGNYNLKGYMIDEDIDLYPVLSTHIFKTEMGAPQYETVLTREIDLWYLDGKELLDGARSLKSRIEVENI